MSVLTAYCDIYGGLNEDAFNKIITNLQNQRPSLFNYGTTSFVRNPLLLCDNSVIATIDLDVATFGNPLVSPLPLLPVPGYNGPFGFEYCFQLTKLALDFKPSNAVQLPASMNPPLKDQAFGIQITLSAGLVCPDASALAMAIAAAAGSPVPHSGPPTMAFPNNPASLKCFSMDVFAIFHIIQDATTGNPYITVTLDDLALPGIMPAALADLMQNYLKTVLSLSILPEVKVALNALVFNIGDWLTISPTPISANVPFNPSIQNDQVEVFITLN